METILCGTLENEIEIVTVGVTFHDFQKFLDKTKHLEEQERHTPILWTESLDELYTSKPRFIVKNGKKILNGKA